MLYSLRAGVMYYAVTFAMMVISVIVMTVVVAMLIGPTAVMSGWSGEGVTRATPIAVILLPLLALVLAIATPGYLMPRACKLIGK